MKRNIDLENGKIRWIKTGGGSFRVTLDGKLKIIKENEKFVAFPDDIPEAFRDTIRPVDPKQTVPRKGEKVNPIVAPRSKYKLMTRAPGWFNVVRESDDKIMNESAMRKDEADELLKSLNA